MGLGLQACSGQNNYNNKTKNKNNPPESARQPKQISLHTPSQYFIYTINDQWKIRGLDQASTDQPLKLFTSDTACPLVIFSDIDTVKLNIKAGDTLLLCSIINDTHTVQTTIIAIRKNVQFNRDYITTHDGQIEVCLPEVSELANIMIALTDIGRSDSNMVNHSGLYYKEVMNWFLAYKNEPFIQYLDSLLKAKNRAGQYYLYYATKMEACTYSMDQNGRILKDSAILHMGSNDTYNPIAHRFPAFENFARHSHFKTFFQQHQNYYDSLVSTYRQQIPVAGFKNWLEDRFENKINYVKITFSPLVKGAHSTEVYKDHDFSTALFYIAPIFNTPNSTAIRQQVNNYRILFTEMDHEYNNPLSQQYEQQIDSAFKDAHKWASPEKTVLYESPLKIFDEYMTWAIFTLYCYDNLPNTYLSQIIGDLNDFMVNRRGFIRFKQFNQQLLHLYKGLQSTKKVSKLYPTMIKWCQMQ